MERENMSFIGDNAIKFPLKPVRKTIESGFTGEIPVETVVYLRDVLPKFISYLVKEAVKEYEEVNSLRKKQGIPERKRLNKLYLKSVFERTFKFLEDEKAGETGENNKKTALSRRCKK